MEENNSCHLLIHSKHMHGSWFAYSIAVFLKIKRYKELLRKIPPCSPTSAIRKHIGRTTELQGVEDNSERNLLVTVSATRYSRGLQYFGSYALEEMQQNICLFSIVFLSSLPQHLFSSPSDVLTYIRKVKYLQ